MSAGEGRSAARQLVLDLARPPAYGADEFLVSACNGAAYDAVMGWPDWPDRALLLLGPAGSGKSHLAAIWAERAAARRLDPSAIGRGEPAADAVVMEDCDRHRPDEAAFFHFLNSLRGQGGSLLMTAREGPNRWAVGTPDLLSRLRLAPTVVIAAPDAALIGSVIVKLFADRQITIEEDVVAYAARHCERSFAAVNRFVALADETALASGRRITRPLAAAIVAALDLERSDADQGPM